MKIENIKITNFKSIYGTYYFDFTDNEGIIKLSGAVGSGKTTIGEAILCGLYGKVKEHKNPNLVSWGTSFYEIELNLISKNKKINIKRNIHKPLEVIIDGEAIASPSKIDLQQTLEEFYDVPKIAIERMCIISFSMFNSIVSMNPSENKQFLDNVFGFKILSDYSDEITVHKKNNVNESIRLSSVINDTKNQIEYLENKLLTQKDELQSNIDITKLVSDRDVLLKRIEKGNKIIEDNKVEHQLLLEKYNSKLTELSILGKKEKEYYNAISSGKCPVCGNEISPESIKESKSKLDYYVSEYKKIKEEQNKYLNEIQIKNNQSSKLILELKQNISDIDSQINKYNIRIQTLSENYEELINYNKQKLSNLEQQLLNVNVEVGEWNDMLEFFNKTVRYLILDNMIPHINRSVQHYIDKFGQNYIIKFDPEFKCHIFSRTIENNEISYNDLSTGQRKSLDLTIIFGILENLISSINFNVFFFDELFTNMDENLRNIILETIKKSFPSDKTIFIINHSDIQDDFFNHRINVKLINDKINSSKRKNYDGGTIVIKKSNYEKVF